eukprot:TRINITY_DN19256_c0_g1_i2.p2 TRINITY_DN19256_c0_g1~~TRINITY_DN19256_c0_g1_i2.p2  ORF type:complete len:227 (+),score=56.92 TRINITY_DN19256_c0_g1_i2:770-1450(+)
MFFVAILHIKAFPAEIYRIQALSTTQLIYRIDANQFGGPLKAFANSLSQGDIVRDTVDAFRWGGTKRSSPSSSSSYAGGEKPRNDAGEDVVDLENFAMFTEFNQVDNNGIIIINNNNVNTNNNAADIESGAVGARSPSTTSFISSSSTPSNENVVRPPTSKYRSHQHMQQSHLDPHAHALEELMTEIDSGDLSASAVLSVVLEHHHDTERSYHHHNEYDDTSLLEG